MADLMESLGLVAAGYRLAAGAAVRHHPLGTLLPSQRRGFPGTLQTSVASYSRCPGDPPPCAGTLYLTTAGATQRGPRTAGCRQTGCASPRVSQTMRPAAGLVARHWLRGGAGWPLAQFAYVHKAPVARPPAYGRASEALFQLPWPSPPLCRHQGAIRVLGGQGHAAGHLQRLGGLHLPGLPGVQGSRGRGRAQLRPVG